MIKQRREAIALYGQGGRLDLAGQEAAEITVIERFLPRQMSEEETRAAVEAVIAETGATGIKDMGRAMAELRSRYAGRSEEHTSELQSLMRISYAGFCLKTTK